MRWIKSKIEKKADVTYTTVNPNVESYTPPTYGYPSLQTVPKIPGDKYKQEKKWIVDDEGTEVSTKRHIEKVDGKYHVVFKKKVFKEFDSFESASEFLDKQAKLKLEGKLDPIIIDGYVSGLRGEFLRRFNEDGVENVNSINVINYFQKDKNIEPEVMEEILKKLVDAGTILKDTVDVWREETYGKKEKKEEDKIAVKNEYYPKGLKEKAINNYYRSSEIKRKISSSICTFGGNDCSAYVTEICPGKDAEINVIKKIAEDIYKVYEKLPEVKSIDILFPGDRGLTVVANLKQSGKIKDIQKENMNIINSYTEGKENISRNIKNETNKIKIDTSSVYRRGFIKSAYSLNPNTFLVNLPIDISRLGGFEINDASIHKVAKELKIDLED